MLLADPEHETPPQGHLGYFGGAGGESPEPHKILSRPA